MCMVRWYKRFLFSVFWARYSSLPFANLAEKYLVIYLACNILCFKYIHFDDICTLSRFFFFATFSVLSAYTLMVSVHKRFWFSGQDIQVYLLHKLSCYLLSTCNILCFKYIHFDGICTLSRKISQDRSSKNDIVL